MRWELTEGKGGGRADPRGAALADRHYSRQRIGAKQFVPPAACRVFLLAAGALRAPDEDAVWVTTHQRAEHVKHAWAGAWVNSLFRNESAHLSSELITEAVAATLAEWPDPPALGIVSFVDASRVRSSNPGYCYRMAGWQRVGSTKKGLLAFQLLPDAMPAPEPAAGRQRRCRTNRTAGR
jgi:hypothetical protein